MLRIRPDSEHDAAESHFGVKDVRVSSGLHREEAHRFYEAAGYAKTGYRFRKVLALEPKKES